MSPYRENAKEKAVEEETVSTSSVWRTLRIALAVAATLSIGIMLGDCVSRRRKPEPCVESAEVLIKEKGSRDCERGGHFEVRVLTPEQVLVQCVCGYPLTGKVEP